MEEAELGLGYLPVRGVKHELEPIESKLGSDFLPFFPLFSLFLLFSLLPFQPSPWSTVKEGKGWVWALKSDVGACEVGSPGPWPVSLHFHALLSLPWAIWAHLGSLNPFQFSLSPFDARVSWT